MLKARFTSRFKRDYKKVKRQGRNIEVLKGLMVKLQRQEELESKYRDHTLVGNWKDCRECHLEPDWFLIYRIESGTIVFIRTGSHAEIL